MRQAVALCLVALTTSSVVAQTTDGWRSHFEKAYNHPTDQSFIRFGDDWYAFGSASRWTAEKTGYYVFVRCAGRGGLKWFNRDKPDEMKALEKSEIVTPKSAGYVEVRRLYGSICWELWSGTGWDSK